MTSIHEISRTALGRLTGIPFTDDELAPRPFTDEDDYWELALERMFTREALSELREQRTRGIVSALEKPEVAGRMDEAGLAIGEKVERLDAAFEARVAATDDMPGAPRILRFAFRARLSPDELDVLNLLVYTSLDSRYYGIGAPVIGLAAKVLGFTHATLLSIFDSTATLVRLGALHVERSGYAPMLRLDLKLETSTLKALRGIPLTSDEQVSLGVQLLEELIDEERGCVPGAEPRGRFDTPELAPADDSDAALIDDSVVRALDDFPDDSWLLREEIAAASDDEEADGPDELPLSAYDEVKPYANDLDYLSDFEEWFFQLVLRRKSLVEMRADSGSPFRGDRNPQVVLRQREVRCRLARTRIDRRLEATRSAAAWKPRAEELQLRRGLDDFEKHVLLLLACVSASIEFRSRLEIASHERAEVGELLFLFFDTLGEQMIARRYFYRSSPLVRDGYLLMSGRGIGSGFLGQDVEIDRVMADYLLGIEAEAALEVAGSHLYFPNVDIDRVILNTNDKELVLRTVESFPAFQEARKRSGLDEIVPYGTGIVLLFYGDSGTGKTMFANGLAAHMRKKLLLVNFPSLGHNADETLRFLFREAKVHNAILFFDECEGVFESRVGSSGTVLPLLTEIERHDGIVILATNRQFDLDEAMHRRITLAVEFHAPDVTQREEIWKAHIPPGFRFAGPIDFASLAYQFELTGGLIKNAVVAALSMAASERPDDPVITQEMLEHGARLQMRSRLRMASFEDRLVPKRGLGDVIVDESVKRSLGDIIALEKARRTLVAEWGFSNGGEQEIGTTALFFGKPGTGKTLSAEVVAFELGRPVKRIDAARVVSMWVGEGAKNIEAIFRDAREHKAVLLFDEADALFAGRTSVRNSTDRYANLDVAILLRELERFPGVVILTTNLPDNVDPAFARRIRFHVEFEMPGEELRRALWRRHLPKRAPLADDVSFDELAKRHELTGAQIRNAAVKAAARAALRVGGERRIFLGDLVVASEEEIRAAGNGKPVGFKG